MSVLLLVSLLALSAGVPVAQTAPPGTILPVRLNSGISSSHSRPGQKITARIMQRVSLPGGLEIRAGSKLVGHVIRVRAASRGQGAEIAFRFDTLRASGSSVPLAVSLRALASFMEMEDARIPPMGPDRGTSEEDYTTVQVGGDVVYRGGGPVMHGGEVVGRPVPGGVLVRLRANPERGCRGSLGDDARLESLWLFSSAACGTYGLPHVIIRHAGRTAPAGEIVLSASEGRVNVRGGAGMLLRVLPAGE